MCSWYVLFEASNLSWACYSDKALWRTHDDSPYSGIPLNSTVYFPLYNVYGGRTRLGTKDWIYTLGGLPVNNMCNWYDTCRLSIPAKLREPRWQSLPTLSLLFQPNSKSPNNSPYSSIPPSQQLPIYSRFATDFADIMFTNSCPNGYICKSLGHR